MISFVEIDTVPFSSILTVPPVLPVARLTSPWCATRFTWIQRSWNCGVATNLATAVWMSVLVCSASIGASPVSTAATRGAVLASSFRASRVMVWKSTASLICWVTLSAISAWIAGSEANGATVAT
ncbi:hypothetical protein SRABI128_03870 [Microbacterium sp. Bi128]|nr:hypothetical protein SRABI128_03870 [Microbacterium sp. Bi128]